MRKFKFPDIDATGGWVAAFGIWFHIVAGLVHRAPDMAVTLAEFIALTLTVCGGYKILDELARVPKRQRDEAEKQAYIAAHREQAPSPATTDERHGAGEVQNADR
ncbi:TPA: type-F conjugative transfer system pilin chaperone TraQ [Serratia marcescens]